MKRTSPPTPKSISNLPVQMVRSTVKAHATSPTTPLEASIGKEVGMVARSVAMRISRLTAANQIAVVDVVATRVISVVAVVTKTAMAEVEATWAIARALMPGRMMALLVWTSIKVRRGRSMLTMTTPCSSTAKARKLRFNSRSSSSSRRCLSTSRVVPLRPLLAEIGNS